MKKLFILLFLLLGLFGCSPDNKNSSDTNNSNSDSDTGTNTDADTSSETNSETKTDTETSTNSDTDTGTGTSTDTDINTDINTDTDSHTDKDTTNDVLAVVNVKPFSGETEVLLDDDIVVVFSHDLDISTDSSVFSIVDSTGTSPVGTTIFDYKTIGFSPARLRALETYTVTVSAGIAAGALTLANNYQFTFSTGETNSNGSVPPNGTRSPLGPGALQISAVPLEYSLLWSGENASSIVSIEDPPFNPEGMENPNAPDADSIFGQSTAMYKEKLPVVGQFDTDLWDETAVLNRNVDGALKITLLDTTASKTISASDIPLVLPSCTSFDATAADFDLDGRDEILIAITSAIGNIKFFVIDYNDMTTNYEIIKTGELPNTNKQFVKVAAGDLDADEIPEAVFLYFSVSETVAESCQYVIHDDLLAGMNEIFPPREAVQIETTPALPYRLPLPTVDVITADVDGDGAAEVIIDHNAYKEFQSPEDVTSNQVFYTQKHELKVADSFKGTNSGNPPLLSIINETYDGSVYRWRTEQNADYTGRIPGRLPILLSGFLTQSPKDNPRILRNEELMVFNKIYRFKKNNTVLTSSIELEDNWPKVLPTDILDLGCDPGDSAEEFCFGDFRMWEPEYFNNQPFKAQTYLTNDVKIGDVDGDMKDDIALLRKSSSSYIDDIELDESTLSNYFIRVDVCRLSVQADGTLSCDISVNALENSTDYLDYDGRPTLSLANVDNDTLVIEQIGHGVSMSDNKIVAVLAAAPWDSSCNQNTDNFSTQFMNTSSQTTEKGAYVTASAGVTLGLEFEPSVNVGLGLGVEIKLGRFEAEVSAGIEGEYHHQWMSETVEEITYSAGSDNNLVIFDGFIYDNYMYQIVSHPNAAHIGKTMTINFPAGKRRYAVSQGYYNAHNGEQQVDVDSLVLSAIPGDLSSYPTRQEALTIMAENEEVAIPAQVISPPEGLNNETSQTFSLSSSESNAFSVGMYASASLNTCNPSIGGWSPTFCYGVEASASMGYEYAHEWGTGLGFGTTLGGIAPEDYSEKVYDVGLFAYKTKLGGSSQKPKQHFLVVNYFVE